MVRDGPFDIRGRGWDFFEKKIVCFQTGAKKINVLNQVKKKIVFHSVNFVKVLFPGSYKGLQITQKLTCIKRVDLPSSSTFGKQYTWY